MNEEILQKIMTITERFFETATDPEQIPTKKDSLRKLLALHPGTFQYRIENNEPVSWVMVLPTSNALAEKFLQDQITERELLDMTEPQPEYDAIYLCAAFTVKGYRRKGHVLDMLKDALCTIPHAQNVKIFAWPYSDEGEFLIRRLERELGTTIHIKR